MRDDLSSEHYELFLKAYQNSNPDDYDEWSLVENVADVSTLKISGEASESNKPEEASAGVSKTQVDRKHDQIAGKQVILVWLFPAYVTLAHICSELDKRLDAAATLDLLIMLDCTGSMEPFITVAGEHIQDFVRSVGHVYPNTQLRLGFVGYRDHCDGAGRIVDLPFTTDISEFEAIVASQAAYGGGDGPEDVLGALQAAVQFQWTSAQRVLYHIGDYPCHGLHYHDNLPDDYPCGDPHGLEPRPLLQALAMHRVRYYFGTLTDRTDRMLQRFAEIMGPDFIEAAPMNSRNMIEVITSTVTTLLSTSLSSSSSVESGAEEKEKEHVIVPDVPRWSTITPERAITFVLNVPPDYSLLCSVSSGPILETFPDATQVQIKCAPHPFAKGRNKLAYYAQQLLDEDTLVRHIVLKEPLSAAKSHQSLGRFEQLVSCQRAAISLAAAFNRMKPSTCAAIEFAPVRVLQFLARPGRPYFIEEDQIPGEWERYSNNTGWCAPFPTPFGTPHQAVQTFSHWTHHVSGGKLMVTDCQGCYNKQHNSFLLTDPAVHSEEAILQYGSTNMGRKGYERFFKSHQCNAVCVALRLPSSK